MKMVLRDVRGFCVFGDALRRLDAARVVRGRRKGCRTRLICLDAVRGREVALG